MDKNKVSASMKIVVFLLKVFISHNGSFDFNVFSLVTVSFVKRCFTFADIMREAFAAMKKIN